MGFFPGWEKFQGLVSGGKDRTRQKATDYISLLEKKHTRVFFFTRVTKRTRLMNTR